MEPSAEEQLAAARQISPLTSVSSVSTTPRFSKRFFLAIIILFILGITLVSAYVYYQNVQGSRMQTTITTVSSSNLESWNIYADKEFAYTIKYPQTWIVGAGGYSPADDGYIRFKVHSPDFRVKDDAYKRNIESGMIFTIDIRDAAQDSTNSLDDEYQMYKNGYGTERIKRTTFAGVDAALMETDQSLKGNLVKRLVFVKHYMDYELALWYLDSEEQSASRYFEELLSSFALSDSVLYENKKYGYAIEILQAWKFDQTQQNVEADQLMLWYPRPHAEALAYLNVTKTGESSVFDLNSQEQFDEWYNKKEGEKTTQNSKKINNIILPDTQAIEFIYEPDRLHAGSTPLLTIWWRKNNLNYYFQLSTPNSDKLHRLEPELLRMAQTFRFTQTQNEVTSTPVL